MSLEVALSEGELEAFRDSGTYVASTTDGRLVELTIDGDPQ